MRAAVYLRVSTDRCRRCRRREHKPDDKCKRFEREQNEANQRPSCLRVCEARGWAPVEFVERESGAKARPEWAKVVEAARLGEVGAVVFWALDRIGRNDEESTHHLRELGRYAVHVVSIQEAWVDQPPGPFRDLMLKIVTWYAEGERRRLITRTKEGQARARLEGKTIGRPGKVTAFHVSLAKLCRDNGTSWAGVARHMAELGHPKLPPGTWQTAVKRAAEGQAEADAAAEAAAEEYASESGSE